MNLICILYSFVAMLLKLLKPGGIKAISAENILLRQQLITLKRRHKRSPKLTLSDRLIYGLLTTLIHPKRLLKIAIIIKPSTLLKFYKALVERKYRLLYSAKSNQKSGPKGPSEDIIKHVIEMKKRNPYFGYLRIAMQIKNAFGLDIDKGVIKRILDKYDQYVPLSHPFVERLIGTVRREFLDKTFFWNQHDLENKLNEFKKYYNASRSYSSLGSLTPDDSDKQTRNKLLSIKKYGWEGHCKNLFSLPIAA